MSDVMFVFGGIFLIMTIIGGQRMKTEVTDPDCPEDVENVEKNIKWYRGLLLLWGSITMIGGILTAIKYLC